MTGAALADEAPHYTVDGSMDVPTEYRQWVFLTSSMDLSYLSDDPGDKHLLDNVFVNPAAYKEFLTPAAGPTRP